MAKLSVCLALVLLLSSSSAAQDAQLPEYPLYGRHALSIRGGLLGLFTVERSGSAQEISSESGSKKFVGALTYLYGVSPEWAVEIIAGGLNGGRKSTVDFDGVSFESAGATLVLVGTTYYPKALAIGAWLRPYVSGAAGLYFGSATNSRVRGSVHVGTQTVSERAGGLRLVSGVAGFVSDRIKLGFGGGYHFVSDFEQRIGNDYNYSGPELSVELGFMFGQGR